MRHPQSLQNLKKKGNLGERLALESSKRDQPYRASFFESGMTSQESSQSGIEELGLMRKSTKKGLLLSSKEFDINNLVSYQESIEDGNNIFRKTEKNSENYLMVSIERNVNQNNMVNPSDNKNEAKTSEVPKTFQRIKNQLKPKSPLQTYTNSNKNYSSIPFTERLSVRDPKFKAPIHGNRMNNCTKTAWRNNPKSIQNRPNSTSVEKSKKMFGKETVGKKSDYSPVKNQTQTSIRKKMNQVDLMIRKNKYLGPIKNSGLKKFISKNKKPLLIKKCGNAIKQREGSSDLKLLKSSLVKPFNRFKKSTEKIMHQRFASYEKKSEILRSSLQRKFVRKKRETPVNLKSDISEANNNPNRNNSLSLKIKNQHKRDLQSQQKKKNGKMLAKNPKKVLIKKRKRHKMKNFQSMYRQSSHSKDKHDRFRLSTLLLKQKTKKLEIGPSKEKKKKQETPDMFLKLRAGSPLAKKLLMHKKGSRI